MSDFWFFKRCQKFGLVCKISLLKMLITESIFKALCEQTKHACRPPNFTNWQLCFLPSGESWCTAKRRDRASTWGKHSTSLGSLQGTGSSCPSPSLLPVLGFLCRLCISVIYTYFPSKSPWDVGADLPSLSLLVGIFRHMQSTENSEPHQS